MIPQVRFEPQWDLVMLNLVTSLIQREAGCCGGIGDFVRAVSVFQRAYELVLSWVEVLLAHVAGSAAPWTAHCWCTDQRSASRAAILVLLFVTALANCLSLHIEQTFRIAACDALRFPEGNQ